VVAERLDGQRERTRLSDEGEHGVGQFTDLDLGLGLRSQAQEVVERPPVEHHVGGQLLRVGQVEPRRLLRSLPVHARRYEAVEAGVVLGEAVLQVGDKGFSLLVGPVVRDVEVVLAEFSVAGRLGVDRDADPVLQQVDVGRDVRRHEEVEGRLLKRRVVSLTGQHGEEGADATPLLVRQVPACGCPRGQGVGFVVAVEADEFDGVGAGGH